VCWKEIIQGSWECFASKGGWHGSLITYHWRCATVQSIGSNVAGRNYVITLRGRKERVSVRGAERRAEPPSKGLVKTALA
jgi:hypothetical protein